MVYPDISPPTIIQTNNHPDLHTSMNPDTNQPQTTEDDLPADLVKTPMLIIGDQALHAYKTTPSQWNSRIYIPVHHFPDEGGENHA
jgi:hypothetical protein